MSKICLDEGGNQSGTEVREKSIESWADPICINVIAKIKFGSEGKLK